ncbi:UDP-glucose 4-epimerase [Caldithrix abyssi DSM 13497]|uniref:UDP-glucose 4-epimerase n=1 Tax=Caldithrix abyssi DSM 13497 TaxID=880073 RepID=H1XX73_CALAY|nr:UDP-glucose 4-epimerase GalE [Caldithrix abyssi]APF20689.1 UDP-galactose 4-epimerase [Caldithrix abyssi DSM 13497]EHO40810.1 UDP-glucose 4-epimerase [Caldithrix abyssi DSM 13497]
MTKSRRILVTGGAGYIGSHLVHDLIEAGHQVVVLDNLSLGRKENLPPQAQLIVGDIHNESDLERAFSQPVEVVFHFAAWKAAGESMTNPTKYAQNNICGSLQLIDACVKHQVRYFVFSSSAAVYGDPQYLPVDEKHPTQPVNYYGYTKLAIEENLRWYSQLKGLYYAALRYFNATGYDIKGRVKGREKNPANLSPVVMETLAGERPIMQVFGNDYPTPDGTGVRDYIHVNDLASAHILAMEYLLQNNKNLTVNLGTGRGHSVLEVIRAAEEVTGKKVNYQIVDRRPGDPPELVASCDLAYELLGWKAQYSDLKTIFKSMMPVYLVE